MASFDMSEPSDLRRDETRVIVVSILSSVAMMFVAGLWIGWWIWG